MKIDRLSKLPDLILTHILSLLSIQSAATTSILSRQWRNLWRQHTNLIFNFKHSKHSFEIVNQILPQLTASKIHIFCVKCPCIKDDDLQAFCSSLESWINTICRRQVEHILVCVKPYWGSPFEPHWGSPSITLPTYIFQCQSLVVLALKGNFDFIFNGGIEVTLPNLKKLHLTIPALESDLLVEVFKSCLLLEELTVSADSIRGDKCLDLSALNLKKLVINLSECQPKGRLVISGSKLENFKFHAHSLGFVHFVKYSGELVIADVCLTSSYTGVKPYPSQTAELVQLISSVRTLHLNYTAIIALNYPNLGLVPLLENLSTLVIKLDDLVTGSWNDVLLFLRYSPKLEDLHVDVDTSSLYQRMEWVVPEYEPPCGLTRLKRITMTGFAGGEDNVKMINYILKKAHTLELLLLGVCLHAGSDESFLYNEYELCEILFHLERSSLACEIEFSGHFLRASSKGFRNGVLHSQVIRLGNLGIYKDPQHRRLALCEQCSEESGKHRQGGERSSDDEE